MKIDDRQAKGPGLLLGVGILLLGVVTGLLARPEAWLDAARDDAEQAAAVDPATTGDLGDQVELVRPMLPAEELPGPPKEGLEALYIELAPEAAARIQRVYDRSMESGMIVQEEGDLVPATITHGDKVVEGDVRIKGDYLDHLTDDKWSLRVELKSDKIMGMSRFSIQHPKTRGFLWEWLIMTTSRRDNLLAPRADFVHVFVNGNDLGIYYLEEHFTKELLESMGRREGPIIRFDESVAMGNEEQHGSQTHERPPTVRRTSFLPSAEISAFGEKRLAQAEGLARQLEEALEQMEVIQHYVVAGERHIGWSSLAMLQSRIDKADRTIDDVLDVDLAARMHALSTLFRCQHGLAWKNRRFYHNPITGRLEPVVYDTLAGRPIAERDPLAVTTHSSKAFLTSAHYQNALYAHVAELASPAYLDELFAELEPDLVRFSALMAEEGIVEHRSDVAAIKAQLYDQQVYLRELLRPRDGVNFDCRMLAEGDNQGRIVATVWAMTTVPVVFRGFHFENGRFLAARDCLSDDALGCSRIKEEPTAVVLPHDGRKVEFVFDADTRLATLRDVADLKQSILANTEEDKALKLKLRAEYRYITCSEARDELLWIRRFGRGWREEGSRPRSPELREALEAHPFLRIDEPPRTLSIAAGEWDVEGDLVVPEGYPLHAGPGVTLRFAEGRGIVSSDALVFEGTASEPIVLATQEGAPHWGGVCVLQAAFDSRWSHVTVRDTNVFQRGGWMMTGGITFFRSKVELVDCAFLNAHGEDALNIFGTDFLMERVLIDGVASDAFDGDFVEGTVKDSIIKNSVEDGVDVSGSDIDVVGCTFVAIGDKGISSGEDSIVRVKDCVVESATIGAASKDFSQMDIDGLEIREARYYGLAVYIKKPEFGPSTIRARNLTIGSAGLGEHIVQETCTLIRDGESIPGVPLDVKELYRQKILGQ